MAPDDKDRLSIFDKNGPYLATKKVGKNNPKAKEIKADFVGEIGSRMAVGGIGNLLDEKCRDKDLLALIKYTADEDKDEKILENQKVLKSPVVRNGKRLRQIISRISGKSGGDRKTGFCLIKVLNFLLYHIIL